MKTWGLILMTLMAALVLSGCGPAPLVFQGTVASFDENSKTIVVADDKNPADKKTFSIEATAKDEIGAHPEPGDLVRIAYHDEGGKLNVTRLMNLTRQTEVKGGGGKH